MQLQHILADLDALKKETDALLPLSEDAEEKLRKKLRLEFHYNTNHIEGNTLTYGETELLFLHDEIRGRHTTREIDEMKASEVALRMVEDLAADRERPLTESFIKDLNRVLLKEPFYKEVTTQDGQQTRRLIQIGDYKKHANNVRLSNGELFRFASVEETPAQMTDLIDWYRERGEAADTHLVLLAATLHYRFVRIHPFDDGNGRASRLLMNYVLLRAGYPLVVVRTEDKTGYLSALHDADTGDLESFVGYVGRQCIASLELRRKAAHGESLEEAEDWKKELSLMKNQLERVESVELKKEEKHVREIIADTVEKLKPSLQNTVGHFADLFQYGEVYVTAGANDYSFEMPEEEDFNHFLEGFRINVEMGRFKKAGANVFNASARIQLRFADYTYDLAYPSMVTEDGFTTLSKFYHQRLYPEDVRAVVNGVGKQIFTEIKNKSSL